MSVPERRVLRWDPYLEPDEGDMEFRLTYSGKLLAHRDDDRLRERSLHVHDLRRVFHKQLKVLWAEHPTLRDGDPSADVLTTGRGEPPCMNQIFNHDGFGWLPMVTEANGLICKLDILMLRHGQPGRVLFDVDNRLKTVFDALRKAKGPKELGAGARNGQQVTPGADENPFYVLLEDDKLITHLSVTTDTLLEPVPDVTPDESVRLAITVTVRPYRLYLENAGYA